MSFPEDSPSLPFYRDWAAGFGAEVETLSAGDPRPGGPGDFGGLILSGGGDVDPKLYDDATRHEKTYGVVRERDEMELDLIARFIEAGKPIAGICRGLQILAVYFGGRLHQHVPDVVNESSEGHRFSKGYGCLHPVRCDPATRLGAALRGVSETNSAHHQAMHPDFPPRHLRVAARSPCGIVEAVECYDFAAPILAVQWHPERLPPDHPAASGLNALLANGLSAR